METQIKVKEEERPKEVESDEPTAYCSKCDMEVNTFTTGSGEHYEVCCGQCHEILDED